jgi:hypothetical protein
MRCIDEAKGGAHLPSVLGIYERELHSTIEELIEWHPSVVVHIGAASGYYAVGLALRTKTRQIAFEMDPYSRELCQKFAALNNVSQNVVQCGTCAVNDLAALDLHHDRAAVICDVEGAEDVLLDPARVGWLRRAWIVVELHENEAPGIQAKLIARFSSTHEITVIHGDKRSADECPTTGLIDSFIPARFKLEIVSEGRLQKTPWLALTPKI